MKEVNKKISGKLVFLLTVLKEKHMFTIRKVKANKMVNPIGISISQPQLSWYVESDKNNTIQTAYRVIASKCRDDIVIGKGSFYDSGVVESEDTRCVLGRPVFESATRIYWAVKVWNNHGETTGWCEPQWFETGLLKISDWKAQWIEPAQCPVFNNGYGRDPDHSTPAIPEPIQESELNPCPIVRKQFALDKVVKKARIYATAHGVYQLSLNGQRVGDLEMMPEATPYKNMLQVQTYDVTEQLVEGDNVVGAVLSDGWWAGRVSFHSNNCVYGDRLALLLQINIEYADGTKTVICSDHTCMSYFGEILYSDMGIGEKIDRRMAVAGWDCVGAVAGNWAPVEVKDYGYTNLCGQDAEPSRIKEILKPVSAKHYEDGTVLIDFGQIISGNAKFIFDGTDRCGQEILISYCEQVDANGDYLNNFSGYRNHRDTFILAGDSIEIYEPKFAWRGFRWVQIKGYTGNVDLETAEARLIASDVDKISEFSCSDPKITKLQENIQWTLINNMLSIPTDNPDRERAGWSGDFEMIVATLAYNWNIDAFAQRWMKECRYEQFENGQLPMIIPNHDKKPIASPAGWGDVAVIGPWEIYQAYGDKQVLVDNYEMMQRWMDYVVTRSEIDPLTFPVSSSDKLINSNMDLSIFTDYTTEISEERKENFRYIWNADFQFGDWMTPSGNVDENGVWHYWSSDNNETFYPCYYMAYCSDIMAQIAELLGKKDDAAYYTDLNTKVRNAVIAELFDNGYLPNNKFQGVLVLALRAGLYPDGQRKVLEDRLIEVIKQDGYKLNTGFASMEHVMYEVVKAGRPDIAYDLLLSNKAPSFTYMIDKGATGIWETWLNIGEDGTVNTASYTQYAIGNIGKWLMGALAGISAIEPGYKKLRLAPVIDPKGRITSADAKLETPYGSASISWKVHDNMVDLSVLVPVGCTADVNFVGSDRASENIGSGRYHFNYSLS
jgi:alpha-L-rhamnosidase